MKNIKDYLIYNKDTGIFVWEKAPSTFIKSGTVAGHSNGSHLYIVFDYKPYALHNLAYFYMTGKFPAKGFQMDHINRIPTDNRWCNLRLSTKSQNLANQAHRSKNLFKGITWGKRQKKWRAQLTYQGKGMYLGYYNTAHEAHLAYVKKAKELFGEFACA
jgi:hypothetical protein